GLGAGLRYHSAGHFGTEFLLNAVWGKDYNGDHRQEIPLAFSGLFYFNPQNRFQVYGLLGLGFSVAWVTYSNTSTIYSDGIGRGVSNADAHGHPSDTHSYLGVQA